MVGGWGSGESSLASNRGALIDDQEFLGKQGRFGVADQVASVRPSFFSKQGEFGVADQVASV